MFEWWVIPTVALGTIAILFMIGAPIFAAFLSAVLLGTTMVLGSSGQIMVVNSVYETVTSGSLGAVPLFILLGEVLFRSGSMQRLMNALDTLVGRVPGRQYVLSISLSTAFGMLSGSGIAVAAMLGRSLLPSMLSRGSDPKLSIGTILGGACLAPIIPPSILAILIGTLADVSITDLLIAGVIPGFLLATLYIGYCFLRVWQNPEESQPQDFGEGFSWRQKGLALLSIAPFSLTIFLVMGLIVLGIATPTESAATGVVGAFITAALYRGLTLKMVYQSFTSAALLSAVILLIVASAVMLTQLLAITGATLQITSLVEGFDAPVWVMFLILMAIPFFLCMFIDQIGLMLIIMPIYRPIIEVLGFDPVWFWLIFLVNLTVGGITPPFGYIIFALKASAPDLTLGQLFSASWVFVGLSLIGMAIMALFPPIVTFLPNLIN